MAATMTAFAPTPEGSHEVVDFMTMFTNHNDDASGEAKDTNASAPASALPGSQPTLPSVDPLQVFDAPSSTAAWHQASGMHGYPAPHGMQMPHGMAPVAYAPQVMYAHSSLGQPFTPTQVNPMAQYVEPAALPGSRSADSMSSQSSFSAFGAPAGTATDSSAAPTTMNKASPSSSATAANGSSPVSGGSNSPTTATNTTLAGRRKRKLTPEDKRRICEIYRNSQGKIRQEDIAKEYSVDRSTISKILNQEDRWLDPEQPGGSGGVSRRPGGRYPAIEEEIHRWLDEAVMQGREVRDAEAREEALKIGLNLGYPHFQASSKWWDGVKRRRLEEGRAMPTTRRPTSTPMAQPVIGGLIRTYAMEMPPQAFPMGAHAGYTLVDPGAVHPGAMMGGVPVAMRARSQSSPQLLPGYGQQSPSYGPAPRQRMSPARHSPVTPLSRNRSYHGSSHSSPVGRPSPLHRANSANGRPSPHLRLGASAFGLTPMSEAHQQVQTPTKAHSEGPHPGETTPTASAGSNASVPSLSPLSVSVSEASDAPAVPALSPSTPRTPAQPTFMPSQPDFVDMSGCQPQHMMYSHQPIGCYPGAPFQTPMYPTYEYAQGQW